MNQNADPEIFLAFVGFFNAAPGGHLGLLQEVTQESSSPGPHLAAMFLNLPVFAQQTPEAFIPMFLDALIGDNADQEFKDLLGIWMLGNAQDTMPCPATIWTILEVLYAVPAADPHWGKAAQAFRNKIEVATYHALTQDDLELDLTALQQVLANVGHSTFSVEVSKFHLDLALGKDPPAFPVPSICQVQVELDGKIVNGSGVLVSPNVVLTAAHVVIDADIETITITFDAPGADNAPQTHGVKDFWLNDVEQDPPGFLDMIFVGNDFSLLVVDGAPGADIGWMGIAPSPVSGPVWVSGYPGTGNGEQTTTVGTATHYPSLAAASSFYEVATSTHGPGSSGGPLWLDLNGHSVLTGLLSAANPTYDLFWAYDVGNDADFITDFIQQFWPEALAETVGWWA